MGSGPGSKDDNQARVVPIRQLEMEGRRGASDAKAKHPGMVSHAGSNLRLVAGLLSGNGGEACKGCSKARVCCNSVGPHAGLTPPLAGGPDGSPEGLENKRRDLGHMGRSPGEPGNSKRDQELLVRGSSARHGGDDIGNVAQVLCGFAGVRQAGLTIDNSEAEVFDRAVLDLRGLPNLALVEVLGEA